MDEDQLVSHLRSNNYYLITDEQGVELYSEAGDLIVCKDGEYMNIPNTEAVRKAYGLPPALILGMNNELFQPIIESHDEEIKVKKLPYILKSKRSGSAKSEASTKHLLKDGEIDPQAVEVLLKFIESDKYQKLFDAGVRKTRVWDRITEELEGRGFYIPGQTKREKSQRLFQKWRNMKRSFLSYERAKDLGKSDKKKPAFYDLMLRLVSKEMFKEEDVGIDQIQPNSSDSLDFTHIDHDYGETQELYQHATMNSSTSAALIEESNGSIAETDTMPVIDPDSRPVSPCSIFSGADPNIHVSMKTPAPSVSDKPAASNQSSASLNDVLQQIKTLHETALEKQEQNFSKVVSLLETQISLQQNLNALISEYVANHKKRRKSDSRSKHSNSMDKTKD